ncbi:MAG TPA: hypothetical protein PKA21_09995, partial [Kiritimatiellia bacterium]|nr:hypothetical protein [Kiritimatiellia bacterium]
MMKLFGNSKVWLAVLVTGLLAVMGCESGSSGSGGVGGAGQGGGFIWKPKSESDGRLVVLLPPQYRQRVSSVFISDSNGKPIEVGRFAGDNHNGNRPHFRFSRHGSAYGNNIYVVADLNDGGSVHWVVPR